MVLWIGVDDTDSLEGMCTTFLLTELVDGLTTDLDLVGYPRLVRLNPSIPWKTRGNGAVCFRLGRGRGRPFQVGEIRGRPVRAFPYGDRAGEAPDVLRRACRILERWAAFEDRTTNPGLVVLERRPPAGVYWKAVRSVVALPDIVPTLSGRGVWKGYKNCRGLIGATAATAWRPRDRTYELLAYRARSRWGRLRTVSPESVLTMDERFPTTFNNIDRSTARVAIAPHSPCPVLLGIRGDDPLVLPGAWRSLQSEPPSRWLIVESNQGTDDHIVPDDWHLRPYLSTSLSVRVTGSARTIPGGHVFVPAAGRRPIELAFYEPAKSFRRVARGLMSGDRLRVWGSVRDDLRSLNVEKIRIDGLASSKVRIANPICPSCGKSMKSVGKGRGFRCPRGHARASVQEGTWIEEPRTLETGWYEPPAFARRHLAKPLQRIEGLTPALPFGAPAGG